MATFLTSVDVDVRPRGRREGVERQLPIKGRPSGAQTDRSDHKTKEKEDLCSAPAHSICPPCLHVSRRNRRSTRTRPLPHPLFGFPAGTYFFGTSDTLIVLAAVEYVARKRSLNPFWLPTADEDWFLLRDMDREQLEAKRKHNLALPVSARSTFLSEVRADHLSTGLAACS